MRKAAYSALGDRPVKHKASISALLLILAIMAFAYFPVHTKDTYATTHLGEFRGSTIDGVDRFLGIPYAKPPVGALRWMPPKPISQAWQGQRNAKEFKKACVQGAKPTMAKGSQEDCLYLNIWSPAVELSSKALSKNSPNNAKPELKPVMVWIHGGGLMMGSANESPYNGEYLAREQDVVVVTLNYRLSFLGFLALPSTDASQSTILGNQGFLDQVAALQWIKENISAFNGDPNNVTVFGESGGAISSCMLLASPLSDGLIHRVIMQSGVCGIQPVLGKAEALAQSQTFFEKVGCGNTAHPLSCAQELSIEQIQNSGYQPSNILVSDSKDFNFYPLAAIESDFLPEDPIDLLSSQSKKNIPILLGVTKDEGSLFTGNIAFPSNVKEYQQQLDEMVPGYSQELMALYPFFEHQKIGETFSSIFTHTMEACPSLRIADIWSVKKPVYFYEFNEQPTAPLLWLMTLTYNKGAADLGVHHGADIPYVFGHSSIAGSIVYKRQKKTRKLTMQYWTNFARSGNPNGNNLPTWPIYHSSSSHDNTEHKNIALSLKSEPELRTAYLEKYCKFWNEHQEFSFW